MERVVFNLDDCILGINSSYLWSNYICCLHSSSLKNLKPLKAKDMLRNASKITMAFLLTALYKEQVNLLRNDIALKQQKLAEIEGLLHLLLRPSPPVEIISASPAEAASPSKRDILFKLKDKESLRIFTNYGRTILAEGVLYMDSSEKKGYHVYDNETRKTYKSFTNWSLSKKKEKNSKLKADNGYTSVHVQRDGNWVKMSTL